MYALNGRVGLVTGAGGGIGTAIARRLTREGMAIAVLDRLGRIDVLVNNAGVAWMGPALDMPLEAASNATGQYRRGVHCEPRCPAAHDGAGFGVDRQPRLVGGQDR